MCIDRLTDKEKEVAELVVGGLTNREIAGRLGVTVSTVKTHIRHMYIKLEINTRTKLIKILYK